MKTMRLGIIALMVAALLCGCSSNKETPTNEVLETDVSVVISDENTPTSDISFSDDKTVEETISTPEISTEPIQPKNDTPATTTSKKQTNTKQQDTASSSDNQTQTQSKTPETTTTEQPVSETPKPTQPPVTPSFDIDTYITYANNYGIGIGLKPDSTATACWDNPLIASASSTTFKRDIEGMLNWYVAEGYTYFCVWSEKRSDGKYNLYIGYA